MKHLKFRVWDKDLRKMHVCGEDIHDSISFDEDGTAFYYNLQNGCGSGGEDTEYVLMQYTGLDDIESKNIFDRDLVEIKGHPFQGPNMHVDGIYEVGYNDSMELCCGSWLLHRMLPYITVVGNIYENPELREVPHT